MSGEPQRTREQLHAEWVGWVNENLGTDPNRESAAATAAVDQIAAGAGPRAATAAAANDWRRSGPPGYRLWRISFWGLLVNDGQVWILALFVLFAQILWSIRPLGYIGAICLTVPAAAALTWKVQLANRLAAKGAITPGRLVDVKKLRGENGVYFRAMYRFESNGPHLVFRTGADTPDDVLVLVDPDDPTTATVLPDLLPTA